MPQILSGDFEGRKCRDRVQPSVAYSAQVLLTLAGRSSARDTGAVSGSMVDHRPLARDAQLGKTPPQRRTQAKIALVIVHNRCYPSAVAPVVQGEGLAWYRGRTNRSMLHISCRPRP